MNSRLKNTILNQANLESALLGPGFIRYFIYRSKFLILGTLFFYFIFFAKVYFLGDEYSNFYIQQLFNLEKSAFWISQILWLSLMSIDSQSLIKTRKAQSPFAALIFYSLLIPLVFGTVLHLRGLIPLDRLTIYGSVSIIFMLQIHINILAKGLHAVIYKQKRVYIKAYWIFIFQGLLLLMQILLWKKYDYWSVPIVYLFQVILIGGFRLYSYYQDYLNTYSEIPRLFFHQHFKSILFPSVFNQKTFIEVLNSITTIFPEVLYFVLINLVYFKNSNFTLLISLMMPLIIARTPTQFLQDWIKYREKKYHLIISQYHQKLITPILVLVLGLGSLSFAFKTYFLHFRSLRLAVFALLMSVAFALYHHYAQFFFIQRSFGLLRRLSLYFSVLAALSITGFHLHLYKPSLIVVIIGTLVLWVWMKSAMKTWLMTSSNPSTDLNSWLKTRLSPLLHGQFNEEVYELITYEHSTQSHYMKTLMEDLIQRNFTICIHSKKIFYVASQSKLSNESFLTTEYLGSFRKIRKMTATEIQEMILNKPLIDSNMSNKKFSLIVPNTLKLSPLDWKKIFKSAFNHKNLNAKTAYFFQYKQNLKISRLETKGIMTEIKVQIT